MCTICEWQEWNCGFCQGKLEKPGTANGKTDKVLVITLSVLPNTLANLSPGGGVSLLKGVDEVLHVDAHGAAGPLLVPPEQEGQDGPIVPQGDVLHPLAAGGDL